MKLLFCQDCKDIVAPFYEDGKLRHCNCNRHSVWWEDRHEGTLKVKDIYGKNNRAYVIGLSNKGLLEYRDEVPWTTTSVQSRINLSKVDTVFKKANTLAWRMRPGENPKTSWA